MPSVARSALVSAGSDRLYSLINDIERYPSFVPYCEAAALLSDRTLDANQDDGAEREIVASLTVARGRFRERFTTRNRCWKDQRVQLRLVDGPLEELVGEWRLDRLNDAGCAVDLAVDYRFSSGLKLLSGAVTGLVARVADDILDAFCREAEGRR
ncbi:MAG: type II toxin-antitoxin system RatA family toxin [Pseudomonadota bacterium]